MRITEQLRDYMERCGDVAIFFECAAKAMVDPATIANASSPHRRFATAAPPPTATSASLSLGASCTAMVPGPEKVIIVSNRNVYFLPDERASLCDVSEVVCHAHCASPFPVLEIKLRNDDGTSEARSFALDNEYLLRRAAAVFTSAAPHCRMLLHAVEWLVPPSSLVGNADNEEYDVETRAAMRALEQNMPAAGRPTAETANKLERYRKVKALKAQGVATVTTGKSLSSVAAFGPGKYGQAAEVLSDELGDMLAEMDRLLHACGAPEPVHGGGHANTQHPTGSAAHLPRVGSFPSGGSSASSYPGGSGPSRTAAPQSAQWGDSPPPVKPSGNTALTLTLPPSATGSSDSQRPPAPRPSGSASHRPRSGHVPMHGASH